MFDYVITARALAVVRRAMPRGSGPERDVHFHSGPQGRPIPCFDARCPTPRLE